MRRRLLISFGSIVALSVVVPETGAQQPPNRGGGAGQPAPPPTARAIAPQDYTGYWVSVVTEDWRWRMVTPPKGDYASVPLNAEGRKVADTWDMAKDKASGNECKPFGAAGLMRLPLRLHITWQDDTTLKIETDAGQQTRLLHFDGKPPTAARSWQGYSVAEWVKQRQGQGIGGGGGGRGRAPVAGGHLKVSTTQLRAGYLRKNGVPYSDNAVLTEYFVRDAEPSGLDYLTIVSVVEDPQYLTDRFVTSTEFKLERDNAKWHPTGCEIDPPLK